MFPALSILSPPPSEPAVLWRAADLSAFRQRLHSAGGCAFLFDTLEIRATLMGLPLDNPEVLGWLRQYLIEGEQVFSGGDRSQ